MTRSDPTTPTAIPTTPPADDRSTSELRGRRGRSSAAAADELAGLDLLRECTARDRRIVERHLTRLDLPAGTTLLRVGDPATNLFLVLDGHVEVRPAFAAAARAGADVSADPPAFLVGPGRHLGELDLLRGVSVSADAVTATPCRLGVLGARMFHVLCRDLPPFGRALLADLAERCARVPVTGDLGERGGT